MCEHSRVSFLLHMYELTVSCWALPTIVRCNLNLSLNYINKNASGEESSTKTMTAVCVCVLVFGFGCVGVRIQSIETISVACRNIAKTKLYTRTQVPMNEFGLLWYIFRIWRIYPLLRSSTHTHTLTTNGNKRRKNNQNKQTQRPTIYIYISSVWIVRGIVYFFVVVVRMAYNCRSIGKFPI